jgi:ATP-dependent helicase/nuclease subunit A
MIEDVCELYGVNEEQARALDIKSNTALRAGAGSGKTRVLTKRFVRLLLENPMLSLDGIAAITFTKKAATEMKDRIRKELSEKTTKTSDKSEKKRLSKLKMQITNAKIDTIHGFCGKIIRDNFAFHGIDPDFGVIEEVDRKVILSRIADEAIRQLIENTVNGEIVKTIAKTLSTGFFNGRLKEGIISAYQAMKEKGYDAEGYFKGSAVKESDETDVAGILEKIATKLIVDIDKQYKEYKDKENLLDFNDLEIHAEKLLQDENIREGYFNHFATIMVDEFQDVNHLQKRILDQLTHKNGHIPAGRLFIVGDHKQSIYGFRGSDYRVFEEACTDIACYGRVEHLNNCYRSTGNIINTVNQIFSRLLSPYERLEYPAKQKENGKKVELITWEKAVLKENKPITRWDNVKNLLQSAESKEELKVALEAEYDDTILTGKKDYQGEITAGVIQKLISEGFLYRDIAILLRSRTSLAEIENALVKKEIPYCVLGGIGFWDRQEINDILLLYGLIFFPDDRLSLFSVLRSPIFGFSDDLLLSLSMFMRKENVKRLDDLMTAFSATVSREDAWLVKRVSGIFATLLPIDGLLNAIEVIKKIIVVTGYDEMLLALPQGEKKLRNLEKLLRIVQEFEDKGLYSARELLEYLEILKETSGMDGEAFLDNEDSDAVKILTIHASKGLEFKAVVIPDMDRLLDSQSKRNKPLFFVDQNQRLIAMGLDESMKLNENATPEYARLYLEKLFKELEDSRRLFYVAATRAREYLGFIGEKQEVDPDEDIDKQNSFMKQLLWAMNKAGSVKEIVSIDVADFISNEQKQGVYPPPFIAEMKVITEASLNENSMQLRLEPCNHIAEGNISITSWMKYRDCPRRFYLENLAGLQDKTCLQDYEEILDDNGAMNAADFGTLLHAFLEKVDISNIDDFKVDITTEVAATSEKELSMADKELFGRSVQGFIKIEKEHRKESRGILVTSLKEFGFRVPFIEGLNLTGFVDRIDIFEKEKQLHAIIIDYKTNRLEDKTAVLEKAQYYKEQMLSYAWALSNIQFYKGEKVAVNGAMLYFLYNGEAVSVNLDNDLMEGVIKKLVETAPWLLGNRTLDQYQFFKTKKCSWCNCKKYCENLG